MNIITEECKATSALHFQCTTYVSDPGRPYANTVPSTGL